MDMTFPAAMDDASDCSGLTFGLLGADAEITAVAAEARRRGARIVEIPEPASDAEAASWQRLLDESFCAAVLVGTTGWNAARAEAVRMLVQAGRTLVLAHPLEPSMLWAFELDMIRRDSGAVLIPCLPDRLHPFIARLKTAIESGLGGTEPLGEIESVKFERLMPDRTKPRVLAALARDTDLIRALTGDPARLGTLGAADPDSAWSTLAVGFSGPTHAPVRWQVAPGSPAGLTITLQYARGAMRLTAPDDETPWTWFGPPAVTAASTRSATVLDELLRSLRRQPPSEMSSIPPATWPDAARAIELADTVPRSLAKGRAVDLHQEEFSELGTFRGTMASLGCGLVLLALLVLLAATLVAGIAAEFDWELGKSITGAWPVVVLAVLSAFLALQLLPLLIEKKVPATKSGENSEHS
jgi:predicted dehydrogenase